MDVSLYSDRPSSTAWTPACVSKRLEGNVNHHAIQEMLGHANLMHTMDTCSHVLPNMAQQAAERLDAMLG